MPQNLSQVRMQLEAIAKAARLANLDLTELRQTLTQIASASLRGGAGTPEGIQGMVGRMLGGQVTPGMRVGQGTQVSRGQAYYGQIYTANEEFLRKNALQILTSIKSQETNPQKVQSAALTLASARKQLTDQAAKELAEIATAYNVARKIVTTPSDITTGYTGAKITTGITPSYAEQTRYPQLPAWASGVRNEGPPVTKYGPNFATTPPVPLLPANVPSTIAEKDAIRKIEEDFDNMYRRLWREAEETIRAGTQKPKAYSSFEEAFVAGESEDLLRIQKGLPPKEATPAIAKPPVMGAYGGDANLRNFFYTPAKDKLTGTGETRLLGEGIIKEQSFEKIITDVNRLNQELFKSGKHLTAFEDIKGVKILDDGFSRLTLRVKDAAGNFQNLIYYADQFGNAFTTAEYKDILSGRKARPPITEADVLSAFTPTGATPEQIALARQRSEAGYAMGAKYGFGKETLKSVKIDQPANVAEFAFAMQNANGVTEKMVVNVDKYGQALVRTNRRLLSFTDSIIKNTREVLTWSFGVGLVYGAYSKLGEIIDKAVQNQSKLADVTIALGNAQRNTNDIFGAAADIASQTGEAVDAVIDTYATAYRAVGAIEEPTKRWATANKLLTDSTVLNKLSSLDGAEAIDVLSGSLRQADAIMMSTSEDAKRFGSSMAGGVDLLDRWVRVTKVANVDMTTLATAFSVTAESALNAGTSIEELNAIIAVLSEKIGGLGGKETGNAVRALIGGVYQQQAATALNQFGIAVADADGKMRDFMDISRDIYELYNQGIIDTTQLNKLGYTLGGGVRRGQQYVAFLSDYKRIQKIVMDQEGSQGEAARAVAIKMETVETASVKLNNSFQNLAQSLGTKGGLLDLMTGLNNVGAGVLDIFAELVNLLGTLTIPATFLTVLGLMNTLGGPVGKGKVSAFLGGMGSMFAPGAGGTFEKLLTSSARPFSGPRGLVTSEDRAFNFAMMGRERLGRGIGRVAPGLLLGALPALSTAAAGKPKEAALEFGAAAVGAIVGGLAGPGGSVIGAFIGSAIGQTFTKTVEDNRAVFTSLYEAAFPEEAEKPVGDTTKESDQDRMIRETVELIYGKTGAYGAAQNQANLYNLFNKENLTTEQYLFKQLEKFAAGQVPGGGVYGQAIPKEVAQEMLNTWRASLEKTAVGVPREVQLEETTFYTRQEELSKEIVKGQEDRVDYINQLAEAYRKELYEQYKAGKVTRKDYQQSVLQSFGAAPSALRVGTAMDISGIKVDWEDLTDTIMKFSEEDSAVIMSMVADIEALSTVMDKLKGKGDEITEPFKGMAINYEQAKDMMESTSAELVTTFDLVKESLIELSATKVDLRPTLMLENQRPNIERIITEARSIQQREFNEQLEQGGFIDEAAMENYITSAKPILIDFGDMMNFYIAQGITDARYIQQAIENLELPDMSDLGYQFMDDITQAQFESIMPQYNAIRSSILSAGGTSEESPLLTFFQDSSNPLLMTKDWKIVQYLLQEILKTEEKQLDGIYNLPSGASFYVPYQAWKMDTETRQAGAEAGGPTDVNVTTDLDQPVNLFDQYVKEFGTYVGMIGKYNRDNLSRYDEMMINELRLDKKYGIPGSPGEYDPSNERESTLYAGGFPYYPQTPTPAGAYGPRGATSFETTYAYVTNPLQASIDKLNNWITSAIPQISPETESLLGPTGGIDFTSTLITPLVDALTRGFMQFFNNNFGGDFTQPQTTIPETNVPEVQTNLKVELSSQTQLIVDGRILADVVKPYLYNDLVTYQQSAGTTGTAFVAA